MRKDGGFSFIGDRLGGTGSASPIEDARYVWFDASAMSYRTGAGARAAHLLAAGGAAFRVSLGAGYLLAPARMAAARLAPPTDDAPDARLFVRGFGGHQLVTGAIALAALRERRLLARALALNALIDGLDLASAALEVRARGRVDRTLAESMALSATAVAWALAIRLALGARAIRP
jgi:hypothetical protein